MQAKLDTHIRIRFVDKSVEQLYRLPNPHSCSLRLLEVFARLKVERDCLLLYKFVAEK